MKKSSKILALVLTVVLALSLCLFVACNADNTPDTLTKDETKIVRISTTTSVNDSGLMPYLQPFFKADTGYDWEIASAGTGAAIKAAQYGNADVILVHSKKSEEEFVNAGFARTVDGYKAERISFMYNYFVLVGPTTDAAGAKDAATVKDAFAAIADNESLFVSRGDQSGTHNKEWTLWPAELGLKDNVVANIPTAILFSDSNPDGWYISAGQGMGACLTMANEKGAYCLTDKATFLSYKNDKSGDKLPNLSILYEADNDLKNTYSMIAVKADAPFTDASGAALPAGTVSIDTTAAEVFINWMTSEHAKALISFYGETKYGGSLFSLMDGYLA